MQLNPATTSGEDIRHLLSAIAAPPRTHAAAAPAATPSVRPWYVWPAALLISTAVLAAALLQLRPAPVAGTTAAATQASPAPAAALAPAAVSSGSGASVLDATGFVQATRQATVSSEVTGRLAHVYTREGEYVKRGQVLAELDTANADTLVALGEADIASRQNQVREMQLQLADVRHKAERTAALVEKGFVSRQQLDSDQYRVSLAQAQLVTSEGEVASSRRRAAVQRQQRASTRILAPFDGLVVEQPAQVGEIVSPMSAGGFTRSGIATLLDTEHLEVLVNVSEQFIGKVRTGQPVSIRPQAYPALTLRGEVSGVMPAASRDTAAVKVRLTFLDKDARVLPNMGVNVAFH